MDWGRARYRQAHKMPSQEVELAGLLLGMLAILFCAALYITS